MCDAGLRRAASLTIIYGHSSDRRKCAQASVYGNPLQQSVCGSVAIEVPSKVSFDGYLFKAPRLPGYGQLYCRWWQVLRPRLERVIASAAERAKSERLQAGQCVQVKRLLLLTICVGCGTKNTCAISRYKIY